MSEVNLDDCFSFALDLVKKAGVVFKDGFKSHKSVECKSSYKDLVTETDKNIEALLIDSLKAKFPSHDFIGEETVAAGVKCTFTERPTWIIDPVDGTMNFVHRLPFTCISVGFWVKKRPEIAIIFNPMLDQLFTARYSKGSFLNGEKIEVSSQKDFSKSLIAVEMGTRNDQEKTDIKFRNMRQILSTAHGLRSFGSAAYNMSLVAMGGIDAYIESGIHAWDMAAGALLVQEAGGYVCDVDGSNFNILNRRIICASSKEIADQMVKRIEIYEEEWD